MPVRPSSSCVRGFQKKSRQSLAARRESSFDPDMTLRMRRMKMQRGSIRRMRRVMEVMMKDTETLRSALLR